MDARVASARAKAASRYVASSESYGGGGGHSRAAAKSPARAPRAHMRVRREPMAVHYEAPRMYYEEDVAATVDFAMDDEFALDDELKAEYDRSMGVHRRPQRVKYVKFKTRVQPEVLVPYLYGSGRSRVNEIMERTGCTIDYCPQSPEDEADAASPSRCNENSHMMDFLAAAESSAQLELGCRLLRVLVDRVQLHIENKLHAASSVRFQAHLHPRETFSEDNLSPSGSASSHEGHSLSQPPDSHLLKSEPHDGGENREEYHARRSMGSSARHRYHDHWVEDDDIIPADRVWSTHPTQAQHMRVHHPARRYHRPVYRRILVDEEGYEVHPSMAFEPMIRRSVVSTINSPLLRRQRLSQSSPGNHRSTNSDDDAHLRENMIPPRLPRQSPTRVTEVFENERRASTDGERIPGRGVKRTLDDSQFSDAYPRPRLIHHGSKLYDMGDDCEEFDMSGEGLIDEHNMSERHADHDDPALRDGEFVSIPVAETHVSYPDDKTIPSSTVHTNPTEEQSPLGTELVNEMRSSDTPLPGEHLLDSMQNPGLRSCSSMSDSESEAEKCSTAVMPHHSMPQSRRNEESQSEHVVSASNDCVSKSSDSSRMPEDPTNTEPHSADSVETLAAHESTKVASHVGGLDQAVQTESVQMNDDDDDAFSTQDVRGSVLSAMQEKFLHLFRDSSHIEMKKKIVMSKLLRVATKCDRLSRQSNSYEELTNLVRLAKQFEADIWRQDVMPFHDKHEVAKDLEIALTQAVDRRRLVGQRIATLSKALEQVVELELGRLLEHEKVGNEDQITSTVKLTSTMSKPQDDSDSEGSASTDSISNSRSENRETERTDERCEDSLGYACLKTSPSDCLAVPHLEIPKEVPVFVSGLITELEQSIGLSAAMASAQRRLLREINKSDPYYYLNAMHLVEGGKKGRGSTCPFGCSGASAHKWERKVVSQISSRMKWFDSVAYSLAKVSGGKELLSRKKMNSTIRKLHLVALQLHCLIAHLYCLRKRVVCREIDSLPTALNNSYYEKRMNGYKSRLKLTLHQQPPPLGSGISLPPEELLRDTFEFFPELLLCVDIWGHDFRLRDGSMPSKVPCLLFDKAARQAFDFENDSNGLLQGICEELLNILCLWNDFKWGESLESLTAEQILAFEAKVKASIRKILVAHANHLFALWSARLIENESVLNHVRLTQSNVYYSEQSSFIQTTTNNIDTKDNTFLKSKSDMFQDDEDDDEKDNSDESSVADSFLCFRPESSSRQFLRMRDTRPAPDVLTVNLSLLQEDDLKSLSEDRGTEMMQSLGDVSDKRQHFHSLSGAASSLLSTPYDKRNIDLTGKSSVLDLLSRLSEARSIAEDAIRSSEGIVYYSLAQQRGFTRNSGHKSAVGPDFADSESMSDQSADDDDAIVKALLSKSVRRSARLAHGSDDQLSCSDAPSEAADVGKEDAGVSDADSETWKQPDMKDLIEIVNSTNHEVAEICTQRARSARVRDKLQAQSLELARQSIQIFQTILYERQDRK